MSTCELLLTGSTGFLGRALVAAADTANVTVIRATRATQPGSPDELALGPGPWRQPDFRMAIATARPDAILNAAGYRLQPKRRRLFRDQHHSGGRTARRHCRDGGTAAPASDWLRSGTRPCADGDAAGNGSLQLRTAHRLCHCQARPDTARRECRRARIAGACGAPVQPGWTRHARGPRTPLLRTADHGPSHHGDARGAICWWRGTSSMLRKRRVS